MKNVNKHDINDYDTPTHTVHGFDKDKQPVFLSIYVFRFNYDDCYDFIKSEIVNGRLRQGWGCEGTDLLSTDIEGFKNAGKTTEKWNETDDWLIRRHNLMTGDIVIVPKLVFTD